MGQCFGETGRRQLNIMHGSFNLIPWKRILSEKKVFITVMKFGILELNYYSQISDFFFNLGFYYNVHMKVSVGILALIERRI